jgi:putative two-component system response regulator
MRDATILIVEDHDILREGLSILLQAEGFRVLTAHNGLKALDQMRASNPDLILSDITMPEMDGYEFYKAVRARSEWVTIPFVFLTARGEREDLFASKKLGVEDYLIKPVDRNELVTTIRSRLDRSNQLMLFQLQNAYEASLIMLANAIELRDQYTRGHVERVMKFCLAIAKRLDWPKSQLESLRYGAILHDIGKIYVSESILTKPDRLDSDEWEEMKQHTVVGAELLKSIPYLAPAISIIRSHHERWDGQGYPDGLSGERIPLSARIVSVADSLDAMTSNRVYQSAIDPQQARQEIWRGSGTRYDPVVVQALERAWPEILSYM